MHGLDEFSIFDALDDVSKLHFCGNKAQFWRNSVYYWHSAYTVSSFQPFNFTALGCQRQKLRSATGLKDFYDCNARR